MVRRSVLLLVTAAWLAVAGAGLFVAAAMVHPAAGPASAAPDEAVVRRFYVAVNEAIATGDAAALRTVVAPDFVDLEPLPGLDPRRDGLEEYVAALAAVAPDLRLEVEAVIAVGGRAMVRLAVSEDGRDGLLGIPVVASPRPWGSVDVLTVENGKVVERRGLLEGSGLLRPVGTGRLALAGPAHRVVTLDRVTIPPGGRYDEDAFLAEHTLVGEDGSIRLMVSEPASPSAAAVVADPAESATEIALPPGEVVVVPNGRGYTATNAGTGDAVLIRLVVAPPRVGRPAMGASVTAESEGPGGRTLAGGAAMPLPAGPLAVAVGRVVLGPGATVAFGEADYVALLSVDTGPISAFLTRAGTVRRGADGSGVRPESARLDPGDGLAIEPGTALVLRNAGSSPVEAVLVTVLGSAR